jgi:pimeloyl-ACP methyl ester carboxylesterase
MFTKKTCLSALRLTSILTVSMLFLVGATTPDKDPFYQDSPRPGAKAGDIINVRQSIFTLDPLTQEPHSGVKAWQVLYQSENATGETIAVSGTVLVPTAPWHSGDRPIIGYSVGTRGIGDKCAPSYTLTQGIDYEGMVIADLLSQGWAVVISDYEGLGTPGPHTYMIGQSQGRVALDIVRAAQRLPEAGLSAKAPIALMGYSQGGASAGWATQLANSYAPELNIVANVLNGVPANLIETGHFLNGTAFVPFALLAGVGLDAAYDDVDLDSYLNDWGRELRAKTGEMCLTDLNFITDITSILGAISTPFSTFDDYTTSNPLDSTIWQTHLNDQNLGKIAPKGPVYIYHGMFDQIVPFEPAAKLRRDWCDLGATVQWVPAFGVHLTSLLDNQPMAIDWLDARFKGYPTSGNCWLP